jgi:hypothetical protein
VRTRLSDMAGSTIVKISQVAFSEIEFPTSGVESVSGRLCNGR